MKFLTSFVFSLDLNLATRSCVVTGFFCNRTARISSSETGPVGGGGAGPLFDADAGDGPLVGGLVLVGALSPFTGLLS